MMFKEIHPCRTTGSQDRQANRFIPIHITCQAIQYLGTFFHDGKVGTECGIVYFVKAHSVKRVNDFTHNTSAFGKSVMITNCNTNCRCNLCNNTSILISQCIPYFIHMCTDGDRTCRTVNTALTTVYTLCLSNLFIECRHDHGLCSTECESKSSDSLKFLAGTYTVAAEDTFVRITDDGR